MAGADDPLIDWSGGAPRSTRFGDIYFSPEDGLAETRTVFLGGCGLPRAWRGRRRFVVAELGFGTGLNIAALLDLWRRDRQPGQRLHVFSVEAFPLARGQAARARSGFPEIAEASAALVHSWPGRAAGFHRVDLPWDVTLDLAVMDAVEALTGWSGYADAWFLDGFAPSVNPEMWTVALLRLVAERSAPGARAATFTVAGAARRALEAAGFEVAKRPGHGRKKQRLEAMLTGSAAASVGRPTNGRGRARPAGVAIVGAGIAGASLARAFAAKGVRSLVVEKHASGSGASGNPSALVTPRLDAGGGAAARLYAQAFARAAKLYRQTPQAVLARGVLQLEVGDRDRSRFTRLTGGNLFEPGDLMRLNAVEASSRLGEPTTAGALWLPRALTVDPRRVLDDWFGEATLITADVAGLDRAGEGWRLLGSGGETLAEAGAVCFCAGHLTSNLAEVDLRPVRGQVSFAAEVEARAATWGGYLAPAPGGLMFGATHDRGDVSTEVRDSDHGRNLALLAKARPLLSQCLAGQPLQGRASVRAATRDHLPVAGELTPGLFVLSGLGGRGFTLAPLLAEHVAAVITSAPSPLPRDLSAAVGPRRLVVGTRARGRRVVESPP